jgi:hypothetical protein
LKTECLCVVKAGKKFFFFAGREKMFYFMRDKMVRSEIFDFVRNRVFNFCYAGNEKRDNFVLVKPSPVIKKNTLIKIF